MTKSKGAGASTPAKPTPPPQPTQPTVITRAPSAKPVRFPKVKQSLAFDADPSQYTPPKPKGTGK